MDAPYHRPPLTKGYLQGREDRASTLIHPAGLVRRARRRGAHAHAGHGPRPEARTAKLGRERRRLRPGARRDRRRRPPAAGRRRDARRHPLHARARQRRQAAQRARRRRARRRRRRLVHRDRGRGVDDRCSASRCTLVMQEALPLERGFGPVAGHVRARPADLARHRDRRAAPTSARSPARARTSARDRGRVRRRPPRRGRPRRRRRRRDARRHARPQGRARARRERRRRLRQRAATSAEGDLRRRRHVRVRQRPCTAAGCGSSTRRSPPRRAATPRARCSAPTSRTPRCPYFWSDLADWATLEYVGAARRRGTRRSSAATRRAGAFSVFYVAEAGSPAALAVGAPGRPRARARR